MYLKLPQMMCRFWWCKLAENVRCAGMGGRMLPKQQFRFLSIQYSLLLVVLRYPETFLSCYAILLFQVLVLSDKSCWI